MNTAVHTSFSGLYFVRCSEDGDGILVRLLATDP
jgi:hypothetical protein